MNPLETSGLLAAVLLALGAILKRAIPRDRFQTRWIPLILCLVGTPLYCALAADWSAYSLCLGLLTSSQAIGLHQIAKQSTAAQS